MTDMIDATPPAPPPAKKARKVKSAQSAPKRTRAPRTTPARTLRRRVDDLGPCHLEAFDRRRATGGERFMEEVRAALDARDQLAAARLKNDAARRALAEAATALVEAEKVEANSRAVLDRLTATAKTLAGLDGDDVEPDAPTGTDADPLA